MTDKTREQPSGAGTGECSTMQTSQEDQARGYLQSLTDTDYIAELQSGLQNAQRLTDKQWRIVVSAQGVEIVADAAGAQRIKLPRPSALRDKRD